jgi:hypothetical protein
MKIDLSVVQRKCHTANDFPRRAAVQARLLAFECHYEQTAKPSEWRFTRADLALLMKRLGENDPQLHSTVLGIATIDRTCRLFPISILRVGRA